MMQTQRRRNYHVHSKRTSVPGAAHYSRSSLRLLFDSKVCSTPVSLSSRHCFRLTIPGVEHLKSLADDPKATHLKLPAPFDLGRLWQAIDAGTERDFGLIRYCRNQVEMALSRRCTSLEQKIQLFNQHPTLRLFGISVVTQYCRSP